MVLADPDHTTTRWRSLPEDRIPACIVRSVDAWLILRIRRTSKLCHNLSALTQQLA